MVEQPKQEPESGILAHFDKCPVCGSTSRLLGMLADEVKSKGLVPENFQPVPLTFLTPPVRDMTKQPIIGMKYPNAVIIVEVCMECGVLYAPQVLRGFIQPQMAQQPPPRFHP